MPFQPGNRLGAKVPLFGNAMRKHIAQNPQDIRMIVEQLFAQAKAGDRLAIAEIADRLDGKPTQTIAGDPDAPLFGSVLRKALTREELMAIAMGADADAGSQDGERVN